MNAIRLFSILIFTGCKSLLSQKIVILGTLQDGGSPHMGCSKNCCKESKPYDYVSSLGIYDDSVSIIIDATPDFEQQSRFLIDKSGNSNLTIFLTHAHIGHYTGLMLLGREVANTKNIPVYAMPRMKSFLENNGPWSQLVSLQNIHLTELSNQTPVIVTSSLKFIPIKVPHRDEFSETVGYEIYGKNKSALYIPDIDKWELWNHKIIDMVYKHDYIFIDGTFFEDGEIPRPMSEVPHPFIEESVKLFSALPFKQKQKIHFIHLNHSNPARNENYPKLIEIEELGFRFARFGEEFELE